MHSPHSPHATGHGAGHAHHAHHAHDADDFDWEAMAGLLEREGELLGHFLQEAAAWLREVPGTDAAGAAGGGAGLPGGGAGEVPSSTAVRRLLDVGSGPGVATCVLARAFPEAEAVAVDQSSGLLERARRRADEQGLGGRLTTLEAALPDDFGTLGSADLIWTRNVVHHLGDQQAALDALAGCLRPGGVLAVVERGLTPRFLPRDFGMGRPGLQARLDAVMEDGFHTMREELPGSTAVTEDWPAMLARAGLVPSGTRTFLTEHPAPLDRTGREYLHARLTRMRDQAGERLAADDLAALDGLLDADAPTGILHRRDAFFLTATTVHTARAGV